MKNKPKDRAIKIPHLNYTVGIKYTPHPERPHQPCCARVSNSRCDIHLLGKPKYQNSPTVAHETLHALQFIAQDRSIDMINEMEHMGYLMQYIMCEIFDMKLMTLETK